MENLKIEDLKNDLFLGDFGEEFTNYSQGYICDIITEISDNNIDIYASDLLEWAGGNYSYIEQSVEEMGIDTNNFDFLRLIQQGQYIYNSEDLYENLEDILKYFMYNYIQNDLNIEEISEEINEELLNFDFNDNNEELENLINHIEEILENIEEVEK